MGNVLSKDGTRIAYETMGAGYPVILVDGAMCHRSMRPLASLLSSSFKVCSYDRRGRGESSDTEPYAVHREIEDLEALIDELGGHAYIYGISSGAVLVIKAAAALGNKIQKLAIYEPPFTFGDEARQLSKSYTHSLNERLSNNRRGEAVELFMKKVGLPTEAIVGMSQSPMWSAMEALAPTLAYDNAIMGEGSIPVPEAKEVQIPSIVLVGGNSPAFMHEAADAIAKAFSSAKLHTLENQAHDVAAEALAPFLEDFFKGNSQYGISG